jgi:hypothetical protein
LFKDPSETQQPEASMSSLSVETLFELQRRVIAERARIVGELAAVSEADALPGDALRHLALLNGAAGAITEEIEAHTPKIGHGGEY